MPATLYSKDSKSGEGAHGPWFVTQPMRRAPARAPRG